MKQAKSTALVVVLLLILAACGESSGGSTTTAAAGEGSTTTAAATDTTAAPAGEPVTIRWFIGLGTGANPEQKEAQEAAVADFNASHPNIVLEIEIVDHDAAPAALATEISSGNAPDIIGPVGREGANGFAGQYLDLEPLVESSGFDMSIWPEATVENMRDQDGTLAGLPFASYPSEMYFSKALFDEAGLPYPPQEYGADGTAVYGPGTEWEGTWDFDKVAEIAKILTVDENGNDATSPDFDIATRTQYGFVWQWTDRLFQQGSFWGAGYPMADDGSAAFPQEWVDEWHWYYDAIWTSGFAPGQADYDAMGGNAFQSGKAAMGISHLWFTCCIRNDDSGVAGDFYDLAVLPSHNGKVTANMHADTFRVLSSTEHPEEAFEVIAYLVTDGALPLLTTYGAAPADPTKVADFLATLDERYPQGVNWQVALDGANFADTPPHESFVPGWQQYVDRMGVTLTAMLTDGSLDLDAEIATLESDLTTIFQTNQ
ncbi:MAG TPA: extracellular solute-binding protein [Acidimicrobiia bacterium]